MENLGEENPIIHHELAGDNFFLVIGYSFQKEMLKEYSSQKIFFDTTNGVKEYDVNLTLIVERLFVHFLFLVKERYDYFQNNANVGTITMEVFMSDDDPAFYNAWVNIIGPAHKSFLCSWHVDQIWRRNTQGKVKNRNINSCNEKSIKHSSISGNLAACYCSSLKLRN